VHCKSYEEDKVDEVTDTVDRTLNTNSIPSIINK